MRGSASTMKKCCPGRLSSGTEWPSTLPFSSALKERSCPAPHHIERYSLRGSYGLASAIRYSVQSSPPEIIVLKVPMELESFKSETTSVAVVFPTLVSQGDMLWFASRYNVACGGIAGDRTILAFHGRFWWGGREDWSDSFFIADKAHVEISPVVDFEEFEPAGGRVVCKAIEAGDPLWIHSPVVFEVFSHPGNYAFA